MGRPPTGAGPRPPPPDSAAAAGESLEDVAESAFGLRWRREVSLPEEQPAPVTREVTQTLRTPDLYGGLLAYAASPPLNLLFPALVLAAAVFLTPWLFLVAGLSFLALVSITYFDEAAAHRVAEARRPTKA